MPEEIQAKGMQHIRNLKKEADKMHKEFDNEPGVFIDCIEAVLLEHRRTCMAYKKKKIAENIETENPS